MANGASRLFSIIKNTSEGTNIKPSQVVSLTVKSKNPLILNRDDKLDITGEFCVFNELINIQNLEIGDKLISFVFNDGQVYFIQQVIDKISIDYDTISEMIQTAILNDNRLKYPIGKIIIETENVNPATYLGFGEWQLWGAGKVPVGVDVEDEDFEEAELTGGEKTHILTINEMPAHDHKITQRQNWYNDDIIVNQGDGSIYAWNPNGQGTTSKGYAVSNNHKELSDTGRSQAHNIMQPYITCYMWKRIS